MKTRNLKYFLNNIITDIKKGALEQSLIFKFENGKIIKMYHEQNCCEDVHIESIDGDLDDLLNTPILMAEEVTNIDRESLYNDDDDSSYTWTYYKFATIKGYVTIRWYGTSNGWYSESVDFAFLEPITYREFINLPKDFYE